MMMMLFFPRVMHVQLCKCLWKCALVHVILFTNFLGQNSEKRTQHILLGKYFTNCHRKTSLLTLFGVKIS